MVGAKDCHCDRKESGPKQRELVESTKMIEMIESASLDSRESKSERDRTSEVWPKYAGWNQQSKECRDY